MAGRLRVLIFSPHPFPGPQNTQVVQQAGRPGQWKGAKGAHSQSRPLRVQRLPGVVPSLAPGSFSGKRFPRPPRNRGTIGRHPATVRSALCGADAISYWGEEAQREGSQGAPRALPLFRRYLSAARFPHLPLVRAMSAAMAQREPSMSQGLHERFQPLPPTRQGPHSGSSSATLGPPLSATPGCPREHLTSPPSVREGRGHL